MTRQQQYDVLVIGSGAAGLTLALNLADLLKVAVLSKGNLSEGSTFWAQGGVAAVLDDTDTVSSADRRGQPGSHRLADPARRALHP